MDIGNFINWFLREFLSLFKFSFTLLDSITFNGTSLLQFCLTVLLISVIISIVISTAGSRGGLFHYVGGKSGKNKGSKNGSNKKGGND